uniref:Uncharacterized protein n=1 Tax=Schistocephalus solidus TaxID=70667 RepID=A0A0X3NZQ5_SCHSO
MRYTTTGVCGSVALTDFPPIALFLTRGRCQLFPFYSGLWLGWCQLVLSMGTHYRPSLLDKGRHPSQHHGRRWCMGLICSLHTQSSTIITSESPILQQPTSLGKT